MTDVDDDLDEWEREEQLQIQRRRLFAGAGTWPRFSKYTIEEKADPNSTTWVHVGDRGVHYQSRELFIRPSSDAILRDWYRPFDFYPTILKDLLDLVRSLRAHWESSPDVAEKWQGWRDLSDDQVIEKLLDDKRQQALRIAGFCDKWGSFGLSWNKHAPIPEFDSLLEQAGYRVNDDYPYFGLSDFEAATHSAVTMPRRKGQAPAAKLSKRMPMFYKLIERRLRDCRESVVSLSEYFDWIWNKASKWQNFRNSGSDPEGEYKPGYAWKEILSGTYAAGIGLQITYDGVWQLDYEFDTLLAALAIMFTLNQVSEKQQIRFCALKDCPRSFVAENPRARYCSSSCSVRARVRRFRVRSLAAKISPSKTVVKTVGELSAKQGKTRGKSAKHIKR